MTVLTITDAVLEEVLSHCRTAFPLEACGLLAGDNEHARRAYPLVNLEASGVSYLGDPAGQFRAMKEMREAGLRMVAIYHSHPNGPAYPSPRDVALAFYDDAAYLIVSLLSQERPETRAFAIRDGKVSELPVTVRPS